MEGRKEVDLFQWNTSLKAVLPSICCQTGNQPIQLSLHNEERIPASLK